MSVLVLQPRDDAAARLLADCASVLVGNYASLLTPLVTRKRARVEHHMAQHNHLFYFGHGVSDALVCTGFLSGRRRLIDLNNIGPDKDRVVVAVACWSADSLGPSATDLANGPVVRAYLGWPDEIAIPPSWPEPIYDAVRIGVGHLIAGYTIGAAGHELSTALRAAHDRYRSDGAYVGMRMREIQFAKRETIYWSDRLTVLGDEQATLY